MTARARGRADALLALAAGALLPLALANRVRNGYERTLAARNATATAAYLTIVTPLARRGAGYDLPQLLIRARALAELPGFSGRFEIYHATAPLIHATAPPLGAATLQRLRREAAVRWTGEAALAPLLDRDGWDVVGAVAARPDVVGHGSQKASISSWSRGCKAWERSANHATHGARASGHTASWPCCSARRCLPTCGAPRATRRTAGCTTRDS